jgi:hypothetical protein
MTRLIAVAGLGALLSSSHALGQESPRPERVAPGVVSMDDRHETFPAIDPVDGSLWFSVPGESFAAQTIMRAPAVGGAWGPAETASFSGRWGDRAPRFSSNGGRLYFTSNRPGAGGSTDDMNIWMVERNGGGWTEPRSLPVPVNSEAQDIHAVVVGSAMYVASDREPGQGRSDVYRVSRAGAGWAEAESLPFNDERSQPDLFVAADEGWMILVITEHPSGLGGDDLFLVRRMGDGWGEPEHLPAPINSSEYEYGPTLSPDGRWLYYTSHRDGTADVYRIEVRQLGLSEDAGSTR